MEQPETGLARETAIEATPIKMEWRAAMGIEMHAEKPPALILFQPATRYVRGAMS